MKPLIIIDEMREFSKEDWEHLKQYFATLPKSRAAIITLVGGRYDAQEEKTQDGDCLGDHDRRDRLRQ